MSSYLTFQQIADNLQIPIRSIYQYNKQGVGPKTTKIGRHFRVLESDYEAWLHERRN